MQRSGTRSDLLDVESCWEHGTRQFNSSCSSLHTRCKNDQPYICSTGYTGLIAQPKEMCCFVRTARLDRPCGFARVTPLNGLAMVNFAGANPRQSNTKYYLAEQNARGPLARPLAMPGPGTHPRGFCRGCPALQHSLQGSWDMK